MSAPLCILAALALTVVGCGDDNPPATQTCADGCQDASDDAGQDAPPPEDTASPGDVGPDDVTGQDTPDTAGDADAAPDVPATPPLDASLEAQGAWGPAAKLTRFITPLSTMDARAMGCLVQGSNLGVGLGNIVLLAGGLEQYLRPNAEGVIPLLLMAQAEGWEGGRAVTEAGAVDLRFFDGVGGPELGYRVRPSSFVGDDPTNPPRTAFPDAPVDGTGWVETAPGSFQLAIPAFGDLIILLPIEYAVVSAQLRVDGPGMSLNGNLTGYVEESTVLGLIVSVQEACRSEAPPAICAAFGTLVERPAEELLPIILSFVQGYDARMDNGFPYPCDPTDPAPEPGAACNAISVCIHLVMDGIAIDGLEEP